MRQVRRQFQTRMDFLGQFHQSNRSVGAGDDKAAARKFDVGRRRFQDMGGDLLAEAFDHLVAGLDDMRCRW